MGHSFFSFSTIASFSCLGFLLDRLVLLGLDVRLHKELGKEVKESQNVHHIRSSDTTVAALAAGEKEVGSLGHHGDELHQLQHGQGRFPPNGKRFAGLGVFGVHADKVISVHDSVDETIEGNGEVDISIIENIGVQPVEKENGGVVVDVQKGKLSPLFAEDNEDGIPKVPCFGDVEHPQQIGNGGSLGVEGVAWLDSVSVTVGQQDGFDCHVRAKHDLGHIVEKFDRIGIDGGNSSLHDG